MHIKSLHIIIGGAGSRVVKSQNKNPKAGNIGGVDGEYPDPDVAEACIATVLRAYQQLPN